LGPSNNFSQRLLDYIANRLPVLLGGAREGFACARLLQELRPAPGPVRLALGTQFRSRGCAHAVSFQAERAPPRAPDFRLLLGAPPVAPGPRALFAARSRASTVCLR